MLFTIKTIINKGGDKKEKTWNMNVVRVYLKYCIELITN